MTDSTTKPAKVPDQDALAKVGETVRKRLDADPKAYRVPTDKAEIYAVGEFLTSTLLATKEWPEDAIRLRKALDDQIRGGRSVAGPDCPVRSVVRIG